MKPRIVFEDDLVQLWHGDYRDILGDLATCGADAVVTDPPYGETTLEWDRWQPDFPTNAASIANALWCFGSFRMFVQERDDFRDWKLSQDLVWEKHNGSSLAADRFRRVHELATFWYRGEWSSVHHEVPTTADAVARRLHRRAKPTHHQGNAGPSQYTSEDGGPRLMRSVQFVRSEHGRALHPTQKPLGILTPLIEYAVPRGGLVVDVFGGVFSTALAARQCGRRAIAVEGRQDFAEAGARRFEQLTFDLGVTG